MVGVVKVKCMYGESWMVACVIDFIHILTFCIWSFKCQFSVVAGALFKCLLLGGVFPFE